MSASKPLSSWTGVCQVGKEIHIDHIKPCAKFDLTKKEEQEKCFHYTNLQPLWAIDNMMKSNKYDEKKEERIWKGKEIGWVKENY